MQSITDTEFTVKRGKFVRSRPSPEEIGGKELKEAVRHLHPRKGHRTKTRSAPRQLLHSNLKESLPRHSELRLSPFRQNEVTAGIPLIILIVLQFPNDTTRPDFAVDIRVGTFEAILAKIHIVFLASNRRLPVRMICAIHLFIS